MNLTEKEVINILQGHYTCRQRYELCLPNTYTQADNEVDFFAVRKSGLCDEFEIKLSRSDFLKDAKKKVKQQLLTPAGKDYFGLLYEDEYEHVLKTEALSSGSMLVNYFWYVVPEGLVTLDEIPEYAGLIEVTNRKQLRFLKNPRKLHKNKVSAEEKYRMARKLAYRFWDLYNPTKVLKCSAQFSS